MQPIGEIPIPPYPEGVTHDRPQKKMVHVAISQLVDLSKDNANSLTRDGPISTIVGLKQV